MKYRTFVLVLSLFILSFGLKVFGQNKNTLKGIKKISLDVRISYLSGNEEDYKSLPISAYSIKDEATLSLRLAGIQVSEELSYPLLVIRIEENNNERNYKEGKDGWYHIRIEIFVEDFVKLKKNPKNIFITTTWIGDRIDMGVKEEDTNFLNNSDIASHIIKSFLLDYLEVNPR